MSCRIPSQPAGTVAQVVQPGYMIGERMLRPALVGVAKGGPKPAPANDNPDSRRAPPELRYVIAREAGDPAPLTPTPQSGFPLSGMHASGCREGIMRRSTERFLTTHTGSLPRPDDLIRMMYAKEEGVPVDRAALAARVNEAVKEVVKKQADAGIDYRQRRRDVEAELRHLCEGPARGLRRHRQHLRLSGPRRFPEPGEARVRRSRALAPQDAGLQRADFGARCRGRERRRRRAQGRARGRRPQPTRS